MFCNSQFKEKNEIVGIEYRSTVKYSIISIVNKLDLKYTHKTTTICSIYWYIPEFHDNTLPLHYINVVVHHSHMKRPKTNKK